MSEITLRIRGVDTLLFRDGRPFTADPGSRADTLLLPPPSKLAGCLRTTAGRRSQNPSEPIDWEAVSARIHVRGPLMVRNGVPLFHAPADALVYHPDRDLDRLEMARLRPGSRTDGAGTDIPGGMAPLQVPVDEKPARGFEFWAWPTLQKWLQDESLTPSELERDLAPSIDERVHIRIVPKTGTAEEGKLFTTRMVAHEQYRWKSEPVEARYSLICRVAGIEDTVAGAVTLGGENRLAVIESADPAAWPDCPDPLAASLAASSHYRMVLATPAIFTYGWIPEWLDKTTKIGTPPGFSDLQLRLVAAAVPRRQPVSGWEAGHHRPKPVRWMAPAGSVYFFEKMSGDSSALSTIGWLASVSDDAKDRSDGFGLALWGRWNANGWNGKEKARQ